MSAGKQFQWVARYENDHTGLPQFNQDGSENKYQDIDRTRLTGLWLLCCTPGEEFGRCFFYQHIPEGWNLILRRQTHVSPGGASKVIHLVGIQKHIDGQNHQMVCALFEDGHVEGMPRYQGDHVVWGKPSLIPAEGEAGIKL